MKFSDAQEMIDRAFALARQTPKDLLERDGALAVGAIFVDRLGNTFETFSGADRGLGHAEELLFRQLDAKGIDCKGGILVCTHEPCNRRSYPDRIPCAQLAVSHGIGTVVFSVREEKPDFQSLDYLLAQGIEVIRACGPGDVRSEPCRPESTVHKALILLKKP